MQTSAYNDTLMGRGFNLQIALQAAGLPASLVPVSMACEVTGYHACTIRSWAQSGRIKAYGTDWGNRYLVDLAEILKVLDPIHKPDEPLLSRADWLKRIQAGAKRRKGMETSSKWAAAKSRMAPTASAVVPPSEPPTE